MDLEGSTYILRNILYSVAPQKSARNRLWTRKLAQVSDTDAALSLKLAKEIVHVLSGRTFVLLIPRDAVVLFTELQLHKLGVERLNVPGYYQYYPTSKLPDRLLFRKKKQKKGQASENAALVVDLSTSWLELLPYEVRHINGSLVIRGAAWLEHLRLETEHDILRIGNPEEWKKASKKERKKLEYCSITAFDRILAIDLLRKNFMRLTPRAIYSFHSADAHVRKATPKFVHRLVFAVSTRNRYRFFSTRSGN